MSSGQRRDVDPAALGRGPPGQLGQLHALGALGQVPAQRPALRGGAQELLPLHLEPVVEGGVVRDVGPLSRVVDRVGQVRVPDRQRRGHPVLHRAAAQPGDRAAVGPVHLQLEELTPVHPDRPGRVHRGHHPAGELQHGVGRVVGSDVVGRARLVPAPRDQPRLPRVHRGDRAEQVLQQIPPVREHVQHDPAAVLFAVVPGGPLRGDLVALEHPVAELQPHRQHPAEKTRPDQPAQLDHARQEQLVLHDAVGDAGLAGRAGQPQRPVQRAGHRLLGVDVLAGGDGPGQAVLARAGHLGVEVDLDPRVGQHVVQAGRPARQAVLLRDLAQPRLAAPDQDRLGVHGRAVRQWHAALLPDAEQRPDQMLAVAHPPGDPVHGDVQDLVCHRSPFTPGARPAIRSGKALSKVRLG
jgi:hypothetical protein